MDCKLVMLLGTVKNYVMKSSFSPTVVVNVSLARDEGIVEEKRKGEMRARFIGTTLCARGILFSSARPGARRASSNYIRIDSDYSVWTGQGEVCASG